MKIYKYLLITVFTFTISCTNGFQTINENPLAINQISPDLVLPIMEHAGFQVTSPEYQRSSILYAGLYCQYIANTSANYNSGNYVYNNSWTERGFWTPYYQKQLKNLKEIQQSLNEHPEYSDMYQIMRIVTAVGTMRLTDTFGDIPYFEAGKGETQNSYDSQKDIYYDIFKELSEAVELLKQKRDNQLSYGNEDLIYRGDTDKWIKFANSLRLRAAIRLSFIDPEKAREEGEAVLKETLFMSNEDNACVEATNTTGVGHPLINCSYFNEFKASKTIVDILLNASAVKDPRLTLMLSQTEAWVSGEEGAIQFKGLPNGLPSAEVALPEYDNTHNSGIWGYMWGYTWNNATKGSNATKPNGRLEIPLTIMNYSEVCFLKAEAALRGWIGAGEAQVNYKTGILASFKEMRNLAPEGSYNIEDDNTYITTGSVKWNDTADFETKLKQIITQKWLGIYPNSIEAWAEFRRTGYPQLIPIKQCLENSINISNGEFIKKLRYVDNELINNSTNANDKSLNNGQGDGVNVRVWWDTGRYK